MPDESNLTCLPDWITTSNNNDEQHKTDTQWSNMLSPPRVNTGPPLDINSMSTEEILSLTNEAILIRTKTKRPIDTPRGKTPFPLDDQKMLSVC